MKLSRLIALMVATSVNTADADILNRSFLNSTDQAGAERIQFSPRFQRGRLNFENKTSFGNFKSELDVNDVGLEVQYGLDETTSIGGKILHRTVEWDDNIGSDKNSGLTDPSIFINSRNSSESITTYMGAEISFSPEKSADDNMHTGGHSLRGFVAPKFYTSGNDGILLNLEGVLLGERKEEGGNSSTGGHIAIAQLGYEMVINQVRFGGLAGILHQSKIKDNDGFEYEPNSYYLGEVYANIVGSEQIKIQPSLKYMTNAKDRDESVQDWYLLNLQLGMVF